MTPRFLDNPRLQVIECRSVHDLAIEATSRIADPKPHSCRARKEAAVHIEDLVQDVRWRFATFDESLLWEFNTSSLPDEFPIDLLADGFELTFEPDLILVSESANGGIPADERRRGLDGVDEAPEELAEELRLLAQPARL